MSDVWRGVADLLRALGKKDLREPANVNALLDVFLWIVVLLLGVTRCSGDGVLSMFKMVFGLTLVCIIWAVYHYTVLGRGK